MHTLYFGAMVISASVGGGSLGPPMGGRVNTWIKYLYGDNDDVKHESKVHIYQQLCNRYYKRIRSVFCHTVKYVADLYDIKTC